MANNVQIKFDIDNKSLQIAGQETMKLTQQIRILKGELGKGTYSKEQFEILSKSLGDLEDNFKKTKARSGDLFTSLQLIPGPIGEIASKINGTIALMKTFSSFSLSDLKFQFKETLDDIKDIGSWIGKTTGLTRIWTASTNAMAAAMRALGIAQNTAAVASKALAAAIAATGIGLLIVGISTLIPKIIDWVSNTKDAEAAQDKLSDSIKRVSNALNAQQGVIADQAELDAMRAKAAGKSEAQITEIRRQGLLKQIQADKDALSEKGVFAQKALDIARDINLTEEQQNKLSLELVEEKNKAGERLYNNNIALQKLDLQAQIDTNEKKNQNNQKATQNAQAEAQKRAQFEADILQKRKDSLDTQIENEIAATNTSETTLRSLYEKRNKIETDALDKAKATADAQLKQGKITKQEYEDIVNGIQARREKIARDTNKAVTDALQDDKKVDEERIKNAEDFDRKIRDIKTASIEDEKTRQKQAREDQYNDQLKDLEADAEFIKKSETEKAEIRKNLKTILNNDLAKIDDEFNDKDYDKQREAADRRLRLLELQGQGLLKGTKAYFQNRLDVLKLTQSEEETELKKQYEKGKLTKEQYEQALTDTEKKYVLLRKDLKAQELQAIGQTISATLDAFANLGNAIAGTYDEEAKTSEKAFEKRKKLQVATAIMSAASGLVQILTQPSTLPSPFDWIVKGINALALGIATKTNIDKIKATKFEAPESSSTGGAAPYKVTANRASGGIVTGAGTSTSDSINARLSNGEYVVNARATSAFLPLLNSINDAGLQPRFAAGGLFTGQESGNFAAENITRAIQESIIDRPVKTYVVGTDMSNQQQFDRTIKSRSVI